MGAAEVKRFFEQKGATEPIIELSESIATVDMAARALHTTPGMIAKTMAFHLKDRDIVIVMRGDARIDNRKYKDAFHTKARMLTPEELIEITGHEMGGVCPFALATPMEVYIDKSLENHEFCYPAAGDIYHAVKLTPARLAQLTGAAGVDVCASRENGDK